MLTYHRPSIYTTYHSIFTPFTANKPQPSVSISDDGKRANWLLCLCYIQGCNFGLKVWVPTQKKNEAPFGPEAREEWGGISLPTCSGVWESIMSSPSGIRGWAPIENFYCDLISADQFCWQQVTANSQPFRPERWWYGTSQSKKWGTGCPSYSINCAYGWLH